MTDENKSNNKKLIQRVPRYLESIIGIFIVPVLILLGIVWKKLPKKPFYLASLTIALIGWTWSWTVTSHVWWSFGERYMLGFDVIPHLPFEEVLFYPFGGILCLFLYVAMLRLKWTRGKTSAFIYWGYLILGVIVFGSVAFLKRENGPHYLTSQLLTYNLICCLILAPFVARDINLVAMITPVLILGPTGYFWDFFALKFGWWDFHAITQIRIGPVPFDEFNFFFYAPPSAISIYLLYCRLCRRPPIIDAGS
ncbi:MAG: hypothetical protein LHV69_08400 [Elusimicrobia bacterium]|nr:hypothetical protein [Candidatus Obscuribacterium magneticum]